MSHIERAYVMGAGTMGAGIAEVLARAGVTTYVSDVDAPAVERGLGKIRASVEKAVAREKLTRTAADALLAHLHPAPPLGAVEGIDLVIEAAPEKLELKQNLLGEAARRFPAALIATNTSSLSVTAIAASCEGPGRVVGLHFFNPAPIMPLLEIVRGEATSPETVARALALAERLEKSPIVVVDSAGFASSRLGLALGLEAMRMLESRVASAADIDKAMELGYRHPMGPLKLTDLVGLDVRLAIAEHLEREIGPQFRPPPILRRLVRAGKLGQKTGEGFYRWSGTTATPKEPS